MELIIVAELVTISVSMDTENHFIKIETSYITLKNKRKLCYAQYGDPHGFPIFFFHGWPGSRLQGAGLHEAAMEANVRLIAIDRPGFGCSAYYDNRALLDWPCDVIVLADSLEINKFSVLGNSGGGPYAAACGYSLYGRLHKVGICVGLSPTGINGVLKGMAWQSKCVWWAYHYVPFLTTLNALGFKIQDRFFPRHIPLAASVDQKMIVEDEHLYIRLVRNRKEAFRQGIKGVTQDVKIFTHDWGFNLKDIKAKMYLWYGAKDKNVSLKMAEVYERSVKGAVLKIYPDVGHLVLTKYAEEILKELAQ